MALENELDGNNEIAHFLEKFKETDRSYASAEPDLFTAPAKSPSVRPGPYARSFEKLEQKIHELEEKFEASTTQNHLILSELSRTREAMERQKDKDAFLEHLSRTIATLRTSVENLTRAQETHSFSYREAPIQRSFDPVPTLQIPAGGSSASMYAIEQETARLRQERDEQDRLFNSLRQKASQLKAVNSALDREIKKAQQEKLDVLKKSADQAKEILSLRNQLTAAEERFKSFDFEGRIISIKREYQQKVSTLETQLKEMSDTCVRQVEEIESLKAKNAKLQAVAAEKETLQAQLIEKDKELNELKQTIASLQTNQSAAHEKQVAAYTARLRALEEQRTQLSLALEKSQLTLGTLRREKETLEKNFKELVIKINQNDVTIGQLKEKIDVLARQNTELTHRNTALVQRNQELTQTATVLMDRNKTLTQANGDLTQENETLTKSNAHLSYNNEKLTKTNLDLTRRNEVLAQKVPLPRPPKVAVEKQTPPVVPVAPAPEKETVSSQTFVAPQPPQGIPVPGHSAALLAARLVQEHTQKKESNSVSQPGTPADDKNVPVKDSEVKEVRLSEVAEPESRTSILHSLGRTFQRVSAPDEEEWEVVSAKAQPTIQSDEDLPEIKVADPVPQENLFDGEDFLEKTGSFIGRMRWSIFRENR